MSSPTGRSGIEKASPGGSYTVATQWQKLSRCASERLSWWGACERRATLWRKLQVSVPVHRRPGGTLVEAEQKELSG
jgi:hypothetical protein